jgi:hypothetical protein
MGKFDYKRREFLKTLGLGVASLSIAIPAKAAIEKKSQWVSDKPGKKSDSVSFLNGINLEFITEGDHFLGLGQVLINDTVLRSNRLPMFAEIRTPDAVELLNYKIIKKQVADEAITIDFAPQKKEGGIMEYMLHTVRNRRNLADWSKGAEDALDTKLTMILKPVKRSILDIEANGFSYQYKYNSASLPIYKITDRGSWEIGGSAKGNEFWMRNGVVDPIVEFNDPNSFYSTEWYLPGVANPNVFQFHPLQTALQGFTFTSADEGTLITWPTKVAHVRSLFEKRRRQKEIFHFHEHCNDLANEFETSPVEVLWIPGKFNRVERANLYNKVREMVHTELHAQIGMKRERIGTYGAIEDWTEADFDKYTQKGLPKLLDAGVKTVFITNQCQNDMNTWGLSNICCNVDYKISESVGEDKLKVFCDKVKASGAKVEMWGNTAISSLTERFSHREGKEKGIKFLPFKGSIMEVIAKSDSPFVRNPSNAIEADHYTPRFCALNLRDKDIHAYWMKQWKYFHDKLGIEGIFLDSSFNMSSDKFHFRQFPDGKGWEGATLDQKDLLGKFRPEKEPSKLIQTQYHAHLAWVVEMQKMGYTYCAEDLGVFGLNRTGPDVADRISSLPIWADSFCDFDERSVKKAGFEPIDIFFKGLAYRMMWKLFWDCRRDKVFLGIEDPFAFHLLKVYNQVNDYMFNREILPEEKGVIYKKDDTVVLWAFENFDYSFNQEMLAKDITHDNESRIKDLKALKHSVYLITKS